MLVTLRMTKKMAKEAIKMIKKMVMINSIWKERLINKVSLVKVTNIQLILFMMLKLQPLKIEMKSIAKVTKNKYQAMSK